MSRLLGGFVMLLPLVACASGAAPAPEKQPHPVAVQAQFDLQCPRPELRYEKISPGQIGVVGCGKRARYERVCRTKATKNLGHYDLHEKCRWELATPVLPQT